MKSAPVSCLSSGSDNGDTVLLELGTDCQEYGTDERDRDPESLSGGEGYHGVAHVRRLTGRVQRPPGIRTDSPSRGA